MKKCLFCDKTATIHLTTIFNKTKREVHLCEDCAREHQLNTDVQQELNIHAIIQFLTGKAAVSDPNSMVCPHCGIKYAQFRAQGRLGCPHDYEVFRDALEPLLERIHKNTRHPGKTPGGHRSQRRHAEKKVLLDELQNAVLEERYEEAARLRDQIRNMGIGDES